MFQLRFLYQVYHNAISARVARVTVLKENLICNGAFER